MFEAGIVIEQARESDIPGIIDVHAKSFRDTYVGVAPEVTEEALWHHVESGSFRDNRLWGLRRRFANPDQSVVFVAREDDEVLGFSGAKIEDGISRMDGLYVVRQGVGIGSELFRRAINWQPPGADIFLTVALNTPAVGFHQSFGFRDTGVISETILRGGQSIPIKEMKLAAQDRERRRAIP